MLALVYLMDATLAPIGFLAVLASEVYENAYLLAIAPAALLGPDRARALRSGSRASWSSSGPSAAPPARWMRARATCAARPAASRAGDAEPPEDRPALERMLLATTVEALRADAGRLSEIDEHGSLHARLAIGELTPALERGRARPRLARRRTRSRSASGTATCWP